MPKIENVKALTDKLRDMAAKAVKEKTGSVVVGYTASYALYVHENMEMKWKGEPRKKPHKGRYWDPQDKAGPKFLEGPARELADTGIFTQILVKAVQAGKTVMQGLLLAGLRLQRESMLRVPVDTGNLKNSAFTRIE